MSAVTMNTSVGTYSLLPNGHKYDFRVNSANYRFNNECVSAVATPVRKSIFKQIADYFCSSEGLNRGLKGIALTGRTATMLNPSLSQNSVFKVGQTFTHYGRDVLSGAAAIGSVCAVAEDIEDMVNGTSKKTTDVVKNVFDAVGDSLNFGSALATHSGHAFHPSLGVISDGAALVSNGITIVTESQECNKTEKLLKEAELNDTTTDKIITKTLNKKRTEHILKLTAKVASVVLATFSILTVVFGAIIVSPLVTYSLLVLSVGQCALSITHHFLKVTRENDVKPTVVFEDEYVDTPLVHSGFRTDTTETVVGSDSSALREQALIAKEKMHVATHELQKLKHTATDAALNQKERSNVLDAQGEEERRKAENAAKKAAEAKAQSGALLQKSQQSLELAAKARTSEELLSKVSLNMPSEVAATGVDTETVTATATATVVESDEEV